MNITNLDANLFGIILILCEQRDFDQLFGSNLRSASSARSFEKLSNTF